MALLIRIDVDRPYGRQPLVRHVLSRVSSDFYLPRFAPFGYLTELKSMIEWLNGEGAPAYVFFRRCTLPSKALLEMLTAGSHEIGLHLENSRSFQTFLDERRVLEQHIGRQILSFSKHGSGGARFGFHHYAPYEPYKYIDWARRAGLRVFLGNLEDPAIGCTHTNPGLVVFPSAFWLEPHWRDIRRFSVEWLIERSAQQDIVLLVHPENVLADPSLVREFQRLVKKVGSKTLP